MGIQTLLFTRGQTLGVDERVRQIYGRFGLKSGEELAEFLFEHHASVMLGFSSIHPAIHDGMVGVKGHFGVALSALKKLVSAGFNLNSPTRIGIEAPITKLNMAEMVVSYILYQRLGISPVFNSYMVTGRTDEIYFKAHSPSLEERTALHAEIQIGMKHLGIESEIGAYLGTRPCHDVEHGLYVPSTGQVFPCTGYDKPESCKGDLTVDSIDNVWRYARPGRKQHICEPKVLYGFPLHYEELVKNQIKSKEEQIRRYCEEADCFLLGHSENAFT